MTKQLIKRKGQNLFKIALQSLFRFSQPWNKTSLPFRCSKSAKRGRFQETERGIGQLIIELRKSKCLPTNARFLDKPAIILLQKLSTMKEMVKPSVYKCHPLTSG